MITTLPVKMLKEKWFIELIRGHNMEKEERKRTTIHLPRSAKGMKLRIRKLTPTECFRLMDVPEDKIKRMISIGEDGKQVISNSQLYKLAGNSIVVACMEKMFKNLLMGSEPKEGEQLLLF